MTHYIVVSENEIVKAEMERPHYSHYFHGGKAEKYKLSMKRFESHIASLPRISIEGKHDWEVWQSVEKGKDFIFIERCCVEFHVLGVSECESSDDDDNPCKCSVAIPIQPTPEGEKVRCEYELAVIEYFGLPEDVSFNKRPNVIFADLVDLLAFFDQKNKPTHQR